MSIFKNKNVAEDRYQGGIDYIDDEYPFFLTHILNIGSPRWAGNIPTARVAIYDKSDTADFQFEFNPNFAELLSDEQMGFIMAHETMHILLNHLKLFDRYDNKRRFNIACDLVINDYLVSQGLEKVEGLCYGEDFVGEDCAHYTVSQVYDKLEFAEEECDCDDGDEGEGSGEGEGEGDGQGESDSDGQGGSTGQAGDECPKCGKKKGKGDASKGGGERGQISDDHGWMEDASDKAKEAADKQAQKGDAGGMTQDLEDKKSDDEYESSMKMAGDGVGDKLQFMEDNQVQMAWLDLLKKVNPDMFRRGGPPPTAAWNKRPRKLAGFPNVILPINEVRNSPRKDGALPSIVVVVDTSGSCTDYFNMFINLARSIPKDKVHVIAGYFHTQCFSLDLDNPQIETGGTYFSPIEQWIRDEVTPINNGNYPNAVVVISDGYGSFSGVKPAEAHQNNWLWLLTEEAGKEYDWKPGECEPLAEYAQIKRKSLDRKFIKPGSRSYW